MRKIALLVLPLLSVSCAGSRWDGVYQVVLSFASWNCTGDTQMAEEGAHQSSITRLAVRHTTADNMVVSMGNMLLTGPHDGSAFEVSSTTGYTDSSCTRNEYNQAASFEGEFTKDLGISGTITVTETEVREGCGGGGANVNETCIVNWSVDGILLDVLEDRHDEQVQWGYTPGSGY